MERRLKICATCSLQLPKRAKHRNCSTCRKVQAGETNSRWTNRYWRARSLAKRDRRLLEGTAA